jgi:hypothetical protein
METVRCRYLYLSFQQLLHITIENVFLPKLFYVVKMNEIIILTTVNKLLANFCLFLLDVSIPIESSPAVLAVSLAHV